MSEKVQTKMLHELIALAKAGKRFRATHPSNLIGKVTEKEILHVPSNWTTEEVTAHWKYEEIREPRVVEFEGTVKTHGRHNLVVEIEHESLRPLVGCKVKVVATEVTS